MEARVRCRNTADMPVVGLGEVRNKRDMSCSTMRNEKRKHCIVDDADYTKMMEVVGRLGGVCRDDNVRRSRLAE